MDDRPPLSRSIAPAVSRAVSRAVSVQADGVRSPVATAKLAEVSRAVLASLKVRSAMLSITLVDSRPMAALNRRHLGHRGPTDVITFALGADPSGVVVADIYICVPVAREQARAHKVGLREEMVRLVVHGTLHACGFEHPEGDGRITSPMWRRQERLVSRLVARLAAHR